MKKSRSYRPEVWSHPSRPHDHHRILTSQIHLVLEKTVAERSSELLVFWVCL